MNHERCIEKAKSQLKQKDDEIEKLKINLDSITVDNVNTHAIIEDLIEKYPDIANELLNN